MIRIESHPLFYSPIRELPPDRMSRESIQRIHQVENPLLHCVDRNLKELTRILARPSVDP
jgi:hypothetical protein